MKDYAECIFNSLVEMRSALLQNATLDRVVEIINTFHLTWLQAVQNIENFKKRLRDTPRTVILKAVNFTLDSMKRRQQHFNKYIEHVKDTMTISEKESLLSDLEIIADLQENINYILIEKQKCINLCVDSNEYYAIILQEIDELLNWLDSLNDHLAIQFSKVLDLKIPEFQSNLTDTLQQVINEVAQCSTPEAQKIVKELGYKGRSLGSVAHIVSTKNDIEISKIVEKITNLLTRINALKSERSSAVIALQHKTIYLEDRLESLENLQMSLSLLMDQQEFSQDSDNVSTLKVHDVKIFNHLLPHSERFHLVDQLVKLWQNAIAGDKCIISILSSTDIKEVFSDSVGHYVVDKYGRKIYTKDDDDRPYQLNNLDQLVYLEDDESHVYYYDECGRYFLNENKERVYKAHNTASEYLLHRAGVMLKVSEMEDGIEYRFDYLGRYFINKEGKRIYRERDSIDEYYHDGLGNLVKIRDEDPYYEYTSSVEPMVTEDSKYLKKTVGTALRVCLAEVVMVQPPDPINYLADRLEKYRADLQAKEERLMEQISMTREREKLFSTKHDSQILISSSIKDEESTVDYNFIHYESKPY